MKILVIAHRVPYPPNKGEKLRTFHQLEHLVELGHSISLIAPLHQASDENDAIGLTKALGIKVQTCALSNKYLRFAKALLTGRSLSEANFVSPAVSALINAEVKDFAPNTILVSASSLIPYVSNKGSARYSANILTDFMDVDSNKWQQYQAKSGFPMAMVYKREAKLIKALEVEAAHVSSECYLIAQAEVDLFKSEVSAIGNIRVLANGMNTDVFKAKPELINHQQPSLLFTGVMDYKPNIDAVLWFVENCWSQVSDAFPSAELVIAGMNPSPAIQKLTSKGNIKVTGFVDDIMPYFQAASVFVAPFQIARGVQNKVLQAMACEIPVVSTERGIEGIVHKNGDDVLLAKDAKEFTAHCIALLNDQAMAQEIGGKARQTIVDHYAWPEVLKPLTEQLSGDHKL
ncbi:TIGR03087 family PEP-CTERM/XrtA system glycosyltransferase [Glaciecola sp. MH2013]|uniref:TIGR03087 family PEP-CTERM/XrtA system glycosyltransferase n=1 Tax=Glaciecola sp. MH2013 TaxID=2785524 RepID=UPI00189F32D6|nr:TIGR03087 family PEP-CTERM/XrtA system glycosyltransferase [Glaciecola sp. MH2013]MBF7072154.1 TIGR03087 family PEP-CTERM/XrtA system glycosyltransferase [Glaciecola sp. MH2013]